MIDAVKLVRAWLLSIPSVAAISTNFFAPDLPPNYDPTDTADGLAATLLVKGGVGHGEIISVDDVDVQVKTWAGTNAGQEARSLYIAIKNAIHGKNMVVVVGIDAVILNCSEMSTGIDMTDPDAGWAIVMGAFHLTVVDTTTTDISHLPSILLEDGIFYLIKESAVSSGSFLLES